MSLKVNRAKDKKQHFANMTENNEGNDCYKKQNPEVFSSGQAYSLDELSKCTGPTRKAP